MPTVGEKISSAVGKAGEKLEHEVVAPVRGYNLCFLDAIEYKDKFLVDCAAAGYPKDRLKLTLDGDQLMIEGDGFTKAGDEEGLKYKTHELSRGYFSRKIFVPTDIMPDRCKAKWENGMIHLVMERTDEKVDKPKGVTIPIEE